MSDEMVAAWGCIGACVLGVLCGVAYGRGLWPIAVLCGVNAGLFAVVALGGASVSLRKRR